MRRLALLTVFFYVCTFASPQRAQAVVPVAVIAAAAIGTAMMSSSIGAYYAQHGVLPQYVSTVANAVGSAADKIFQPAYLAVGPVSLVTMASFPHAAANYLGKDAAIGAKLGDIIDYVNASSSGLYQDFKSLIASVTSSSPSTATDDYSISPAGLVIADADGVNHVALSAGSWVQKSTTTTAYRAQYINNGTILTGNDIGANKGVITFHDGYFKMLVPTSSSEITVYYWFGGSQTTTNDPTYAPVKNIDYPTFKDKLLAPPAGVASEIPHILKGMPDAKVVKADAVPATSTAATTTPALTQANINDAIKANTAEVAQAVADAAAATAAANPTDAAAQIAAAQAAVEAAKAAEEAAKEEPAEETYSPISDTAFTEPYNPGEFDIPARFTTFLNNVKSSGLFSFSNSFFNSLPSGGSPIFEIEGGIFGSHRIDLSETMSGGLAVVKTVLLALFGFLSIRAVIMKR